MKIVNIINHGFIKFGFNLYKNLETINRHNDLILYCTDSYTFECVKKLGLNCEAKLFVSSGKVPVKKINYVKTHEVYDPCINEEYYYINFLKYEAFYQTLKEYGSAIMLDSDILVFGDFIHDTIELLKENDLVLSFENYPHEAASAKGSMVNGGYMGINLNEKTEIFFQDLFENMKEGCSVDMYYTTPAFRKNKDNLKWVVPHPSIMTLNHCGNRNTSKQILKKNLKAYHPTFYNVEQKIQQAKIVGRWFGGDMFEDVKIYHKTDRGDEHLKPL